MTLDKGIEQGIVDPIQGKFLDRGSGEEINFDVAMERGFIVASSMPGVTLKDIVLAGLVDPDTSKLSNLATGGLMSIQEAVDSGFLDPNISRVKDPRTNKLITLNGAIVSGLIDPDTNEVRESPESPVLTLREALDRGLLIDVTRPRLSLKEALETGLYHPGTGTVTDPASGPRDGADGGGGGRRRGPEQGHHGAPGDGTPRDAG